MEIYQFSKELVKDIYK